MPPGVHLVRWEPKPSPIILTTASVVEDVGQFIAEILRELDTEMQCNPTAPLFRVKHIRRLRDFTDKLEQVGVVIEVDGAGSGARP